MGIGNIGYGGWLFCVVTVISFTGFSALFTYVSCDHIVPSCSQAKANAVLVETKAKILKVYRNIEHDHSLEAQNRTQMKCTEYESTRVHAIYKSIEARI